MFTHIKTAHLILRKLALADSEALFRYRGDPRVYQYQNWAPQSIDDARGFIQSLAGVELDTPGTWFQMAITLRESGLLIGDCGMHFPGGEPHQAEIGFSLDPDFQGRGYASEAVTALLDYLFNSLGKHRVYATVDPRNQPSVALLERVGMRQEAHFRESLWFKGAWADDVVYAILDREWKMNSPK